ncbi:hypothetical protein ARNL5_00018 [Anaerolineae bacterium]|nr:hypothetical protein ARNL5_00018 [Anaerolineae bacterium]
MDAKHAPTALAWLERVNPLLETKEACDLMRCSRRQLGRWIASGQLKVIKCGSVKACKVLVPSDSIYEFLMQRLSVGKTRSKP